MKRGKNHAAARPLRHVHFFTETVVAAESGMAKLHLDSVDPEGVGSSLLDSHMYAGGELKDVRAMTLTSLLQRTLQYDDDNGNKPGHLILKVDIEGGEYDVLKEVLESGALCDYASKKGKRVDLVVEFHKWVVKDNKQKREFAMLEKMFYSSLTSCGIHLTKSDWRG